ncbi:hypothetical protein BCR36DRAFT_365674 [Piromyces finnis]|uniref:Protein OS-9 homolog n=1 Tax=Piromyces finnis TaxID=1754191 RepID=A0A1Y1VQF9_9FUNG|nr:hypothetical protein BCR36DRAFT_365674 [Piromyces finnis]|eukprot:ORX61091.1 hypothetical protein BCR36DRAFT_365674 [Piromyces finnis]
MRVRTTLLLLNFITVAFSGITDVYEDFLSKPQYQLYFSAEKWGPKTLKDKEESGNTIIKLPVSKDGLIYACEIEKPIEIPKNQSEEDNKKMFLEKALEKLESMKDNPCIVFNQEWWNYEFCYKKYITQFHEAKPTDPPEHNMHFYLGKYPTEEELENPDFEYKKEAYIRGPFGKNYITQMNINGSQCDITGKPRQTELRFFCGDREQITSVKEISTCNYVVTVNTPKICDSPGFETKKSINSISCHPIYDRDEEVNESNEQPENLPFPVFRRQRSMAEIEKSKEIPKRIYKRKGKKRTGVTFIKDNSENEEINEDKKKEENEGLSQEEKDAEEKRESIKKSLEDQLEQKRNDFLDALLPYANELKDVDVDDVLNKLADSLVNAIDDNTDENTEAKVTDFDFEVVTKEKLKSWLEKNEDKISGSDDMKFEVVLLDKNGKKYEVSNSDTDVDNIMDFLKEFSSETKGNINLAEIKEELKKKAQEKIEELNREEEAKKEEENSSNQEKINKDEL